MAESEIESRIRRIEDRLSKLESLAGRGELERISGIEAKLMEKAEKRKTQDMIIISLKLNGRQTKEEIKTTLQELGKVYGNWFDGGNFNGRLVKKNIVKKEGMNEKNEELYSLTKRGEFVAEKLIAEVNGKS